MSAAPRFSVVIPTRERASTLASCLATCLDQDFDDYEIIVCDNASSPATRDVVERAGSARIAYHRSDTPLAMSDNWDLAVSLARGEYVTVVGDDDGLMPYALRALDRLLTEHGDPDAVNWKRGLYAWPTIAVESEANFLLVPMTRSRTVYNGRERLATSARYAIGPERLPMIYTSIIRRDLIDRHRQLVGRVFPNAYPDMYSAYAFAFLADRFVSVSVPMGIAGLSSASNGVATLLDDGRGAVAREFGDLNETAGLRPHPTVPHLGIWPVPLDDSFQYARDLLFPGHTELVLDRRQMVDRYLGELPRNPARRDAALARIRASLADRPDLIPWFEREAVARPAAAPYRVKPARFGLEGGILAIDSSRFGVVDVAGAVQLTCDLLGVRTAPIEFDEMVDWTHAGGGRRDVPRPTGWRAGAGRLRRAPTGFARRVRRAWQAAR